MDQHTGDKWLIHGTNNCMENQLQNLEPPWKRVLCLWFKDELGKNLTHMSIPSLLVIIFKTLKYFAYVENMQCNIPSSIIMIFSMLCKWSNAAHSNKEQ